MNDLNIIFALFLGFMVCFLLERVVWPLLRDHQEKVEEDAPTHPCEVCPHWEECNCVDDNCPLIKEDT